MFKSLKDKIKSAISKISTEIEEKGKEKIEEVEEKMPEIEEPAEEKGFFEKIKDKFTKEKPEQEKEELQEETKEKKEEVIEKVEEIKEEIKEIEEEKPEEIEEEEKETEKPEEIKEKVSQIKEEVQEVKEDIKEIEEKQGIFAKIKQKIVTKTIDEQQFDELFWNLELTLLENNVAVEVIEKIKQDLKEKLIDQPLQRGAIEKTITDTLKNTIEALFKTEQIDLISKLNQKKPLVICFVGINGSGKTTTIAKIAQYLKKHNHSCVLAAADTFRAAAIDQLQKHADNLNLKLIKHDYGSDAAAVAFDAVKHAEAKGVDAVLIDTAGRMHSNVNLMDEMEKIIRVANPDFKVFVGESITGNDCTEQAKKFNESIGIDGIVLSKADIDEKGGAAISISYVTGKPILFIGTGQGYDDLESFDPELITKRLGL